MTLLPHLCLAIGREGRQWREQHSRHGERLGPSHVAFFILPSWKTKDVSLQFSLSLPLSLSLSVFVYLFLFVCFESQREVSLVDTSCNIQQNFVSWHCLQVC